MNTLISQRIPLQNLKKPSLLKETTSTFHSIVTLNPSSPKKTWKLQAEAKGFGTKSVKTSKKDSEDDFTSKQNKGSNADDDDKISQVVWDRMIVRILFYVGTPMGIGVAFLVIFDNLKEYHIVDFPVWLPFLTTLLSFGTSALGIAYGTLSTSLDPDKKGTVLGWEEVQQNWPEMWKEDEESKR
ncbi:hypothetical protein ACHQM5_011570 [Ranunculus cassubicifolius]